MVDSNDSIKKDTIKSLSNKLNTLQYFVMYSMLIHVGMILYLYNFANKPDSHSHSYANSTHSHSYANSTHSHSYANSTHSHSYADESHNHEFGFYSYADKDHDHDATDIDYKSFSYGGYGTLQAEIKRLDSEISDLDSGISDLERKIRRKADDLHYHY